MCEKVDMIKRGVFEELDNASKKVLIELFPKVHCTACHEEWPLDNNKLCSVCAKYFARGKDVPDAFEARESFLRRKVESDFTLHETRIRQDQKAVELRNLMLITEHRLMDRLAWSRMFCVKHQAWSGNMCMQVFERSHLLAIEAFPCIVFFAREFTGEVSDVFQCRVASRVIDLYRLLEMVQAHHKSGNIKLSNVMICYHLAGGEEYVLGIESRLRPYDSFHTLADEMAEHVPNSSWIAYKDAMTLFLILCRAHGLPPEMTRFISSYLSIRDWFHSIPVLLRGPRGIPGPRGPNEDVPMFG